MYKVNVMTFLGEYLQASRINLMKIKMFPSVFILKQTTEYSQIKMAIFSMIVASFLFVEFVGL